MYPARCIAPAQWYALDSRDRTEDVELIDLAYQEDRGTHAAAFAPGDVCFELTVAD